MINYLSTDFESAYDFNIYIISIIIIVCVHNNVCHNITFEYEINIYIYILIKTYNTELQMVKVHINNIPIANIYIPIPPRDSTSTHYKTADTDIQHCIQYITNIPHSILTGDVNAYSTLCHLYTDDHRGQLIVDAISNSYQTPYYNKLHHQISPRCLTHCKT